MTRVEMDKKIQEVADKIVRDFQPEKIILFGSWAWGTPNEDSDVDLFIVKESVENRLDRQRKLRRLLFDGDFPPLDLLVYNPSEVEKRMAIEDIFLNKIFNEGKVIYAK